MTIETERRREIKRYEEAYKHPRYRMGDKRRTRAEGVLERLQLEELIGGSLLDVGAGRGEGVELARDVGFTRVVGVEPVDYLCNGTSIVQGIATELPFADNEFDVVMCLDVLEHLIPADVRPALEEFKRVARNFVFLTASEQPHNFRHLGDLHISRRPIAEWNNLFVDVYGCDAVEPLGMIGVSPGWLIRI